MILGERLAELRIRKRMSQGDIERRTGLLRCYMSRVENGHTVPSVETLEKLARAYEIPFYQIFYEGDVPADFKRLIARTEKNENGRIVDEPELEKLRKYLSQLNERDQRILYLMAKMFDRTPLADGRKRRIGRSDERNARFGPDRRFKVAVGQGK